MKENMAEVLESLMLPHEKVLEREYQKKFSDSENEKVKIKKNELSKKKPIEIAKLLISKIKSDLSNSPEVKKFMNEIYEGIKEDSDTSVDLVNIVGYPCVLVIAKDGKFDYVEVPVKNLEYPDNPMAKLFELHQIAVLLSK